MYDGIVRPISVWRGAAWSIQFLAIDEKYSATLVLNASGIAVARVGGFGLLSLGLACWPGGDVAIAHTTRALFTYNLLAALYLGYLRVAGGFVSFLLWPACILHALLALLMARPAYESVWHAA